MMLLVKNVDEEDTLLISAVAKVVEENFRILGIEKSKEEETPNRVVLRPGEEDIFDLQDGYILGVEKL